MVKHNRYVTMEWDQFCKDLVDLESRAREMQLHETSRLLNKAAQKSGWERIDAVNKEHKV